MTQTAPFNCLHCGSQAAPQVFLADCKDCYLRKSFKANYFKCLQCRLAQMSPIPLDVSAFYDAYPVHQNKSLLHRWLRRILMAPAYFNPGSLRTGDILLDYGAGDGWFLEYCKARQLTLVGFERESTLADILSKRLKVPVYSDPALLISDFQGRVDAITMHFVMEHLTDLEACFSHVERLLKTGGRFFFTVPNLDSWEAKLFGKKWHGLDPPRHISFPHQEIVQALGRRHHLELIEMKPVPFPNGFAGSIPAVVLGHFNFALYLLALPLGILLSRLAPAGFVSYSLRRTVS